MIAVTSVFPFEGMRTSAPSKVAVSIPTSFFGASCTNREVGVGIFNGFLGPFILREQEERLSCPGAGWT
jgi:hypothetical protein